MKARRAPHPSLLPARGRAVRGNSSIAEAQLIFGVLALRAAWVEGRGVVDGGEVATLEETQSDQIGEAEDRDRGGRRCAATRRRSSRQRAGGGSRCRCCRGSGGCGDAV